MNNTGINSLPKYVFIKGLLGVLSFAGIAIMLSVVLPSGIATVKAAVKNRAAIDLHALIIADDFVEFKYLVDNVPIDLNKKDADGNYPLHTAAKHGRLAMMEILLKNRANINQQIDSPQQGTPLICAVANSQLAAIEFLLSNGADVNLATDAGITPLHVAAAQGNHQIIEPLLAAGASPIARTRDGYTPQDVALSNNHTDAAKLLQPHSAVPAER